MTFANPILPDQTSADSTARKFRHPEELRGDGPDLLCCGHFDGHDVYRRLDVDLYVLVYGDSKEAIFEMFGSKASRMIADGGTELGWGTARAIKKARASVRHRLDEIIIHLRDVVLNLPDEGHDGWCRRAVDTASEAADWIEELRKGVGI